MKLDKLYRMLAKNRRKQKRQNTPFVGDLASGLLNEISEDMLPYLKSVAVELGGISGSE